MAEMSEHEFRVRLDDWIMREPPDCDELDMCDWCGSEVSSGDELTWVPGIFTWAKSSGGDLCDDCLAALAIYHCLECGEWLRKPHERSRGGLCDTCEKKARGK